MLPNRETVTYTGSSTVTIYRAYRRDEERTSVGNGLIWLIPTELLTITPRRGRTDSITDSDSVVWSVIDFVEELGTSMYRLTTVKQV